MMNNPGIMGQQGPAPPQIPPQQQQQQPITTQAAPGGAINPALAAQARQTSNEEILARCLVHTQRLRESLEVLLNTTKQAALIENDESSSSASSSAAANAPSSANLSANAANSSVKNTIDRKLCDMGSSIDQLGQLLDQYDFKIFLTQQGHINQYNELSYEKQGTLIDEWSTNAKWLNKLIDISPAVNPSNQVYRRSNARYINASARSRVEGPSSTTIDRIIAQFDPTAAVMAAAQQQQTQSSKEYAINSQRLSDHLTIVEFSLFRSGLDIYLYIRHCTVEHVNVKPLNEKKQFGANLNSKLLSNYRALDIIAGHIRAAAVYYASSVTQPDQALMKLFVYLSKYQMLHSQKCVNCQKHLLNGLQPTWRDLKTYECYHEECLN